jgi:Dephospho-CoA kinase
MMILHRLLFLAEFILVPYAIIGFSPLPFYRSSWKTYNRNDFLCDTTTSGSVGTVKAFTTRSRSSSLRRISQSIATVPSSIRLQATEQPTDSINKPRQDSSNIYIIGMLGPCGSGKSYACSLLTSKLNQSILGETIGKQDSSVVVTAHHIDTDSLAHAVYEPGSKAVAEIGKEFGEHVIANGTVDRKALGAIVFGDESMMNVSISKSLLGFVHFSFPTGRHTCSTDHHCYDVRN